MKTILTFFVFLIVSLMTTILEAQNSDSIRIETNPPNILDDGYINREEANSGQFIVITLDSARIHFRVEGTDRKGGIIPDSSRQNNNRREYIYPPIQIAEVINNEGRNDIIAFFSNDFPTPRRHHEINNIMYDATGPSIRQARTIRDNNRINVEVRLSDPVQDDSISNHLSDFTLIHPTGYCQTGSFTGFSTRVTSIASDTDANDQYFLLEYTFSSCDDLGTGVYTLRYNGTSITDAAKNVLVLPSEGRVLEDGIPPRILYAESFDTNEDQVVDKVEIRLSESVKDSINDMLIDASDFSLEESFSGITVTSTFDTFSTSTEEIQSTNTINDQYFSLSFTTPPQLNSTGVFTFIHNGSIQDIQNNIADSLTGDSFSVTDGIPPGIRNALTLDTDGDGKIDRVEIELTENIDDSRISADSFSLTPPMEFGTTDTLSNFSTTVISIVTDNPRRANDQYFSLTFTPRNSIGTGVDTLRYFGSSLTDAAGNPLLLPNGYILPEDRASTILLNTLTLDEDGDGNVEKVEIEISESINDNLVQTEVDNNRFVLIPPLGYGNRDTLSDFSTIVTEIATDTAANNQYFSLTFTPTHAMGTGIYRIRFLGISVSTDGAPPRIIQARTTRDIDSRINVEIQLSESVHDTSISNHLSDFTLTHPTGYCQTGSFTGFSTEVSSITNDDGVNDQYFSLIYTPCDSFSTGVYTLHYNGTSITDSTNNALVFPSEGVVLEDKIPPRILYAESFDTNEDQVVDKVEIVLTEPIKDSINNMLIDASNFSLQETFSGETITNTFDTFSTSTEEVQSTNTINDQYFSLSFTSPLQNNFNSTGVFIFIHAGSIQDIQNNTTPLTGSGEPIIDGIPPGIRNALTLDTDGDGRIDKVEIELSENINDTNISMSADSFSLTPPMEFGNTDTLSGFSTEVSVITTDNDDHDQYFSLSFTPDNSKGTGIDTLRYFGSSLTDAAGNPLLLPDGYFLPEDSAMLTIFRSRTIDRNRDGNVDTVEIEASEFINDNRIQTEVSQGRFTLTPPSGYSMGAEVLSIFNTAVTDITNDAGVNDQYFSLSFNPTNVMGTGVDTLKYTGTTLLLPDTGRVLTDGAPPIILRSVTLDTNEDGSVDKIEIALSENINDTNISPNEFSLTSPMEFGTTDVLFGFSTEVNRIVDDTDANDQYYSLTFDPVNSGGTGVDTLRYFGSSLTDAAGNILLVRDGYVLPEDSAMLTIFNATTLDGDGDGHVDKVEIEASESIDDQTIRDEVDRKLFTLTPPMGLGNTDTLSGFSTEVTNDIGDNDQYFSLTFTPAHAMGTGIDTLTYLGNTLHLPARDRVLTDGAPPRIIQARTILDNPRINVEIQLSESIQDDSIFIDSISNHLSDFTLTHPTGYCQTGNFTDFFTKVRSINTANDQYFSLEYMPCDSFSTGVYTLHYNGTSIVDVENNNLALPSEGFRLEDKISPRILYAESFDTNGDTIVDKVEIILTESVKDSINGMLIDASNFLLEETFDGVTITNAFDNFSTSITSIEQIQTTNTINDQYFSLTFTSPLQSNFNSTGVFILIHNGSIQDIEDNNDRLTSSDGEPIIDGIPPRIRNALTLDTDSDGKVDKVEIELTEYINDASISANSFSLTPPMEFGTTDILSNFSPIVTEITSDTDPDDQYFSLTFTPTNSRGTGIDTLRYFGTSLKDTGGNPLLLPNGYVLPEDRALPLIVDKTTDLFPGDDAIDIGVINELRMIFSERVRWDTSTITFVKNTIPPTSTILIPQQNQNNPFDTLVTITIPKTTTENVTNYYTVIEDGAFIDKSGNISSVQDFTVNTAWNFRTRQGLHIQSTDVNSNNDVVLVFNDDVGISDLDSSNFTLRNSLDTFHITEVIHDNSQLNQLRIVIDESGIASFFGDLFLSFDGVGSDGIGGTTEINSASFGILEDFDNLHIDFDRDNPTLDILTFNEDTIHLTFSERVQIGSTTGAVSDFTMTDGKGIDYPNIVMNIIDEVVNDNKLSLKLNISLNSLLGDLTLNYDNVTTGIKDFGNNQLLNFNEVLDIDTISPTIKNIFMVSGGVGVRDTLVLVFSEDVSLSSNDFTIFSLSDEKNISYIITSLIDDVSSTNDTLLLTVRDLSNVTTNLTLTYSGAIIADYGGNNLGHFTNQPILSVFKDNTPLFYCRDLSPFFLNINDIPLGIDTEDTTSVDPPEDDVEKDDFYKIEVYYKQNNVINTDRRLGVSGIFNTAGGELSSSGLLDYTGDSINAGTPSRAGGSWGLDLSVLGALRLPTRTTRSIDTLLLVYIVSKDDGSASKALATKEIYILPERPSLTTDISGRGSLIESSGDYELKFCDGEKLPKFVSDGTSVTWFDDNGRRIVPTNNDSIDLSDIFPRAVNSVVNYDNRSFYNFSFSKLSALVEDSIQGGCPSRKVNISVNPKPSFPAFDSLIINAPKYQYPNQNSLCETDISTDNDSLKLSVTPSINPIDGVIVNSFKLYSGENEERVLISTQKVTQEEFFLFDYSASSTDRDGNVIRSIDTVFHITQISDSTEYFDGCESELLTINIVIHPQPDLPITEGSDGTENEYIFCNVDVLQSSSISIKNPDTSYQYIWYRDEGLTDILLNNDSSIGMDMLIRANIVDIDNFTTDSIYVVARSKGCDSEKQLVTIKNNPNDLGIEFSDDKTGAINGTEFCLSSDPILIKGVLEGNKVDGKFSIDTFGMVSRSNPVLTHTLGTTLDTLAMFNSEDSTLTIHFFGLHSAKQNSLSMVGGSTSVIPIRFTYSDADRCANTYTSTIIIHPLPEIDLIAETMSSDTTIKINFTPKGEVCYDAFFDVTFSGNLIDAAGDTFPINTDLAFYLNNNLAEEATLGDIYTFSKSDNVSSANISEEDTIRLEYILPIQSSFMESDDGCMNTITKVLQVNASPSIEFSFDFDSNDSTDNSFCFTKISIVDEAIKVRKDTLHITATSSTISTTGDTISVPPDSYLWSLSGSSMDLTQGFMDKQNGIVDLFPEILHTAALSNRLEGGSSSEISANFTITDEKGCMGTNSAPVRIHPLPEISFGILRGTDASTIIQSNNELDNLSATICYTEESLIFRGVELAYNDITDETDTLDAIVTDVGFTVNNQPIALQNGQFLFRMSDEYSDTLRYVEDPHSRDTLNILFTYTHPNTGCINTIKKTLYIAPLPNVTDILPIQVCKGDDATVKIEVENLDRVDSIEWSHESSISFEKATKRKGKGDNNSTTVTALYETGTALPSNTSDNLIVTAEVYESGCPFLFSKTILIGEFPDPKVSWLGITEDFSTEFELIENNSNLANNNIDSVYYSIFEENRSVLIENSIGKEVLDTTRTQENNILYPFSNTFFVSGNYGIDVYMRSNKGCDSTINRDFSILSHKEIGVEGYSERFEDGEGGWLVETRGNDNPIFNNDVVSWKLGDTIRSDGDGEVNNYGNSSQFWITGVNKPYEEGEISYVYSPSFDFTESFEKLTVSFDIYFRFESVRDGVVFQYSTSNGSDWITLGTDETGLNWYNARNIASVPGNTRIGGSGNDNFNSKEVGWTDKMLDDSKWLNASAAIPLEDRTSVRFRFALDAQRGSKSEGTIGFAFDNFRISEREKTVLIEHFMSVNNADAKNNHDRLDSLYKNDNAFNTIDIIWINYFMNFTNREDLSARTSNYAINEIPEIIIAGETREDAHLLIDGSFDEIFLNDAENELLGTSGFSIDGPFVEFNENTDMLTISINVISASSSVTNNDSELGIYFVVIEPEVILDTAMGVYKMGDTIKNVVRKILPNGAGKYQQGEWVNGDTRAFTAKWRVSNLIADSSKLQVVAFIQNFDETKNVHQAKISDTITVSRTDITGIDNYFSDVTILYPNPISDHHFVLEFSRPTLTDLLWRMYDQTGKSIKNGWIPNSVRHHQISINDLSDGMYFIMIKNEAEQKTTIKRFLVRKEE